MAVRSWSLRVGWRWINKRSDEMKGVGVLVLVVVVAAAGSVAFAQDKVGIEVCDTFLEKYETCVKEKAGDQRPQLEQMISQLRTQ